MYYHNSFSFIDKEGKDIKSSFKKYSEKFSKRGKPLLLGVNRSLRSLVKAKRLDVDFNMSSIAVSREIVTENGNLLFACSKTPDIYLYFEIILKNIPIYMDPEMLTKYRLRQNVHANPLTSNTKTGTFQLDVREEIVTIALGSGNRLFLKYSFYERYDYLAFSELRKFKKNETRDRRKIFDNLRKLPFSKPYLMPYFLRYLILYLVLFLDPGLIDYVKI